MKSTVTWTGDRRWLGQTESGHAIVIGTPHGDAPKPGPSAMELVLMGAGACSSFDVVSILEKSRQDVQDVIVELDAERAEEPPKVFTRIHMHFVVKGRSLAPAKVERAIDLAMEKYCSASAQLRALAEIRTSYEIVEADLPA